MLLVHRECQADSPHEGHDFNTVGCTSSTYSTVHPANPRYAEVLLPRDLRASSVCYASERSVATAKVCPSVVFDDTFLF